MENINSKINEEIQKQQVLEQKDSIDEKQTVITKQEEEPLLTEFKSILNGKIQVIEPHKDLDLTPKIKLKKVHFQDLFGELEKRSSSHRNMFHMKIDIKKLCNILFWFSFAVITIMFIDAISSNLTVAEHAVISILYGIYAILVTKTIA